MKISDPKEKGIQYPFISLIKDIWHYAGHRRKDLIFGTLLRLTGDIASLYPVYALGLVVNSLTNHSFTMHKIFIIMGYWLLAYIIRYRALYFAKRFIFSAAQAISLDVERHMLSVLISKDSAWHEKESSGVKIKRVERGSASYKEILYAYVNNYIEIAVNFVGVPFILLRFDVWISVGMLVFLVLYFLISKYLQKKCIAAAHEVNVREDELSGSVYEVVSNIRTVRVLYVGNEMLQKVNSVMSGLLSFFKKRIRAFQFRSSSMALFSQVCRVGILAYITYFVFQGTYEVGLIVIFSSYFDKVWENVRELTDVSQDVIVARQSISRMYELVGKEVTLEKGINKFPKEWDALHVNNLSFSYGENEALKDISFKILRGQKVGIVGLSGAGKSTLFKLLIRERTDHTGDIKIGTTHIQDIITDEFYQNISIVTQDTEVFNFSLKDNITISQPRKADDKNLLEKSLETSHVKDFLSKLSNGVDTLRWGAPATWYCSCDIQRAIYVTSGRSNLTSRSGIRREDQRFTT
jgi:ABC-type multidrug transport system fused ATPase/permease subunit